MIARSRFTSCNNTCVAPFACCPDTWTQLTANAEWSKREDIAPIWFGGKFYVMGGEAFSHWSDVWSSTDAITWTQILEDSPWQSREDHRLVEFHGEMVLMGGEDDTQFFNDVWTTPNGGTPSPTTAQSPPTVFVSLTPHAPPCRVHVHPITPVDWAQKPNAAWEAREGFSARVHGNRLYVVGGANQLHTFRDIWWTTDLGKGGEGRVAAVLPLTHTHTLSRTKPTETWVEASPCESFTASSLIGFVWFQDHFVVGGGLSNGVQLVSMPAAPRPRTSALRLTPPHRITHTHTHNPTFRACFCVPV